METVWVGVSGFRRIPSGGLGRIPSSAAGGDFAVFHNLMGILIRNGFRIRIDSVEGRIRVDDGGFLDPGIGIRQPEKRLRAHLLAVRQAHEDARGVGRADGEDDALAAVEARGAAQAAQQGRRHSFTSTFPALTASVSHETT